MAREITGNAEVTGDPSVVFAFSGIALVVFSGCNAGSTPRGVEALISEYRCGMASRCAETSETSPAGEFDRRVTGERTVPTPESEWLSLSSHTVRRAEEAPRLGIFDAGQCAAQITWLSLAAASDSPETTTSTTPATGEEADLGEIAKQTNNPVGSLWMLFFQYDATISEDATGRQRESHSTKFQPVMPFQLTQEWKVITRPVIPIHTQTEVFDGPVHGWDCESGIGDIVLLSLFSWAPVETPKKSKSNLVWGIGPTWSFPTATEDLLGTEKWSVGPAATVFYLGEKWIVGAIWQNWFSFAGEGDRDQVSLTDFQYIVRYRPTPTTSIGMTPNIQRDWTRGDGWSVPVGLGGDITFKIGKMPIRIGAEAQYYLVQPDNFGAEWNFRVFIIPIIPAPDWANQPLFGPR
jgi:hypothetical protein